ncbi:unnamed protein product [Allacma fusca]|uniref:Uncharacterized protein n=1 Tax=Allacma fusca TaxID=39272 RepID=A0A8J2L079_9HEXA|nr:unnamed protein product [Allacma fusca]
MPETELKKRGSSSAKKSEKDSSSSSSKKKVDKSKDDNSKTGQSVQSETPVLPGTRFGPMPGVTKHRLFSRAALILGLMTVIYFTSGKKEEVFADTKTLKVKSMDTVCSPDISKNACQVKKCGRLVTDALVTGEEVYALIDLSRRGFVSHPGLSVMDFTERTLKFEGMVKPLDGVFKPSDGAVFQAVKSKLQRMVSAHFGVDFWKLNLAGPTFMAMIKPGGKDISQM